MPADPDKLIGPQAMAQKLADKHQVPYAVYKVKSVQAVCKLKDLPEGKTADFIARPK